MFSSKLKFGMTSELPYLKAKITLFKAKSKIKEFFQLGFSKHDWGQSYFTVRLHIQLHCKIFKTIKSHTQLLWHDGITLENSSDNHCHHMWGLSRHYIDLKGLLQACENLGKLLGLVCGLEGNFSFFKTEFEEHCPRPYVLIRILDKPYTPHN